MPAFPCKQKAQGRGDGPECCTVGRAVWEQRGPSAPSLGGPTSVSGRKERGSSSRGAHSGPDHPAVDPYHIEVDASHLSVNPGYPTVDPHHSEVDISHPTLDKAHM